MASRWAVALLLLLVGAGCASTRVVRLDTGAGKPLEYAPPTWDAHVELNEHGFEEAVAWLLLEMPLSVRPSRAGQLERTVSAGEALDSTHRLALRREYGRWCEAREAPGDCLSLLEDGLGFDEVDRLKAAIAFAIDPVWEGVAEELGETLRPEFLYAMVVSGLASYVALLAFPEPVVTKAGALLLTAWLVAYLGTGPFLELAHASLTLKRSTERATTFAELEAAGTRFGRSLGRNGTRITVMLVTAALGGRLGARGRTLPGFPLAARLAETQMGLRLLSAGEVRSIAVAEGALVVGLAPNAVSMAARGASGSVEDHHIATIANEKSSARGGPWTPRFRDLFKRAGMELKDAENIVPIEGHRGPHPEQYHREVYRRLSVAMEDCGSVPQCRAALTGALERLAQLIATPGTRLNRLVTGGAPR